MNIDASRNSRIYLGTLLFLLVFPEPPEEAEDAEGIK
jgi:hypothetical protein